MKCDRELSYDFYYTQRFAIQKKKKQSIVWQLNMLRWFQCDVVMWCKMNGFRVYVWVF